MDVAWAGVRPSTLPYALEPREAATLNYNNVNDSPNENQKLDFLPLCVWGGGHDNITLNPSAGCAQKQDLNMLKGYTTFVYGRLIVNHTSYNPIHPACRKNGTAGNCTSFPNTCMVASCTQEQIDAGNYTRIELKVALNSTPNCQSPVTDNHRWTSKNFVVLRCQMHNVGFALTNPALTTYDPCSPWTDIGFFNNRTGRGVHVAFLRHWSHLATNKHVWFAVYSTDGTTARNVVDSIFDNSGYSTDLPIVIRPLRKPHTTRPHTAALTIWVHLAAPTN